VGAGLPLILELLITYENILGVGKQARLALVGF
jgi:hypothetical protein